MDRKNILEMAALVLVIQVSLGLTLACEGSGCNMLSFYNYVNASNSNVVVYQSGVKDVSFTNNLEVRNGAIDFAQQVNSGSWGLTNNAYLEGTRVTFQGVTVGAVDCATSSCGEIQFNQHLEVDGFLDPWAYQRLEKSDGTKILEQRIDVLPGGWLRVDQSGYAGTDNGLSKGFLAQSGWLHSPIGGNNIAWQAGSVDGNWGYNEVQAEWWLNFNQIVSFGMN